MRVRSRASLAAGCVSLLCSAALWAADAKPAPPPKNAPDPAFAKVEDTAGLPRVLLIGDSISIGYTVPVQQSLAGKANVHRIPDNGGPTVSGLANLKKWLGDGKWDVVHFNWGLHDLKFMPDGKRQVEPEAYERNLRELVGRLKATGAKLIWCSTTPVPAGKLNPARKSEDVVEYNTIAQRIMEENGVAIDDLYTFANGQLDKIQLPHNVHFSKEGSAKLAEAVSASIEKALK